MRLLSTLGRSVAPLLLAAAAFPSRSPAAEPAVGFAQARAFATEFCGKCHGDKAQKGGVNLAPFADERAMLRQRKVWRGVVEQVATGQMPPEDAAQPAKGRRDDFVKWAAAALDAADRLDRERPDPGRAVVRRLNRDEYNRTVRDLVGIDSDFSGAVGMGDDAVGESFDNLAAALSLTETLMEKYFSAADLVLERLYATAPQKGSKPKPGTPPTPFERVAGPRPDKASPAREAARKAAERFARRAYRRPVEAREVDRLLALYDGAAAEGADRETALRPLLKAVLVSPNFLLRVERDRAVGPGTAYRAGDHELAVRLSYFFWSSMPDDELFALAEGGELGKPDVYEKQARRMLADPKARALTDGFAAQWLRLRKLPDARPNAESFPTFTPRLRQAMYDEAATFFDKLREEDRSLLELLDADYTYLNQDLAGHYGIKGITGPELRKVPVADPNRGGLLGMAAVLALTSHTDRTSPTLRGKYVLDVVLGTPPPPPPPGVSQIDEAKPGKEAKTFREKLAQHAAQAACASCHVKIDPLGFGLENFDAIGRFRKSGGDVDATGKLPGGEAFDGPKGLKQVLLKRKGRFVENAVEKLLTYALGRELQAADAVAVRAIADEMEKTGYKFSALALGAAKSYPFRHRRNVRADEAAE